MFTQLWLLTLFFQLYWLKFLLFKSYLIYLLIYVFVCIFIVFGKAYNRHISFQLVKQTSIQPSMRNNHPTYCLVLCPTHLYQHTEEGTCMLRSHCCGPSCCHYLTPLVIHVFNEALSLRIVGALISPSTKLLTSHAFKEDALFF